MEKILYVKPAKQAKVIGGTEIRVKDLAQLEGDPQLVEEMLGVVVLRIKGNQEMRLYTSFLDIAKAGTSEEPACDAGFGRRNRYSGYVCAAEEAGKKGRRAG